MQLELFRKQAGIVELTLTNTVHLAKSDRVEDKVFQNPKCRIFKPLKNQLLFFTLPPQNNKQNQSRKEQDG